MVRLQIDELASLFYKAPVRMHCWLPLLVQTTQRMRMYVSLLRTFTGPILQGPENIRANQPGNLPAVKSY